MLGLLGEALEEARGGAKALGVLGLRALGVLGLKGRGWLAAKVVTEAGVCDRAPSVLTKLVAIEGGCAGAGRWRCWEEKRPWPLVRVVGGGGGGYSYCWFISSTCELAL